MKMNDDPRLTRFLVAERAFAERPLSLVDIGARYGAQKHWSIFGDQVIVTGFEPDAEECAKINASRSGSSLMRCFPVALNSNNGKRTLYITSHRDSSSFYRGHRRLIERFPDEKNLIIEKEVELDTVSFDSFRKDARIGPVDFFKIDAEGAELDILKGATEALAREAIGIEVEFCFLQFRERHPLFCDVNRYLSEKGFTFYDIGIKRYPRKALPRTVVGISGAHSAHRGQVGSGDALYLFDAAEDIASGKGARRWDDSTLLKLASIMELYGLNDSAIELIQVAAGHGYLAGRDTGRLIDLLTPMIRGKSVGYDAYMKYITDDTKMISGFFWRTFSGFLLVLPASVRKGAEKLFTTCRSVLNLIFSGKKGRPS